MTPKEKALALIEKYEILVVMWTGGVEVERQNVKQCALIAVEEIQKSLSEFNPEDMKVKWQKLYYTDVKKEIEKL